MRKMEWALFAFKKVVILTSISIILFSVNLRASQMSNDEIKGVVYFSNGSDLIKYNFGIKNKEILFKQGEKSELGKKLTNIDYPVYLKSKNRILFIGSTPYPDPNHSYIFESDLDLQNMKQYRNMNNVQALSLSPDESMLAYYRHPNKLVIKRYEGLEKNGDERIIAHNFLGASPIWISSLELVYNATENSVIKLNIQNGDWQILAKNVFCYSVSPDKRFLLCSDRKKIYLYALDNSQLKLIKESKDSVSSFEIWSPSGGYFLFEKLRKLKPTFNILKFWNEALAERHDIYLYNLTTGEENKIMEDEVIYNGFWLEKDSLSSRL